MTIFYILDILLVILKYLYHFQSCQTNPNQFAKCYSYNSFVRCFHTIWSVESILGSNSRTKILPDMGFGMESQVPQLFAFHRVLREIKWQNWKKIQNPLFWGPFFPKYQQKWVLCKIMLSVLRWKNTTSWKIQKKLCSWEKSWTYLRKEWWTVMQQWFHKTLCLQRYTKESWPYILSSGDIAHLSFWSNFGILICAIQMSIDFSLTYKKSTFCLNSSLSY